MTLDLNGYQWGVAGALMVLAALWGLFLRRRGTAVLRFSQLAALKEAARGQRLLGDPILKGLRTLVLVLLVLALFRPRAGSSVEEVLTPGVDIMIALDLSGSMRALDMGGRSRVDVARETVIKFIRGRVHDRIGLVVFAGRAFTQAPLTLDYALLERLVEKQDAGSVGEDGTAIGMGLATSLNRLKDTASKSKLVILVTDGRSNTGRIEPQTAAELAKSLGIRVYTVGLGSKGRAPIPTKDAWGRSVIGYIDDDIDDDALTQIARTTGGIYRRASDDKSLEEIFLEISNLEKTPMKVREHHLYQELYLWLVVPALVLLAIEVLLANTRYLRIP